MYHKIVKTRGKVHCIQRQTQYTGFTNLASDGKKLYVRMFLYLYPSDTYVQ